MQRSARTPAFFKNSQHALRSLRWRSTWTPPPRFVALMNEDEDLDLVVVSTFSSLEVCCHEELLRMPINGLLRLVMDLNSRLSAPMHITGTLTKSEDQLRRDIEAILGYKRFSSTEQEPPLSASRDSGLGLLGILSAGQSPDPPTTLHATRRKGSNSSLSDRQRLTVSMRGKPRLSDLLEEEPEANSPGRSKGKSPIRRSDRQHSLTQSRQNQATEAATLPRARNLRNFQVYEGHRISTGTAKQRPNFEAPAIGSIFRARPRLYHSLPTRKARPSFESNSARSLKFRRDLRTVPTLGRRHRTPRYAASGHLRKPSLELFEMDRLIHNMLSASESSAFADRGRNTHSDLEEFGVL